MLQTISLQAMLVILPLVGAMLCFLLPQRVKFLGLMIALAITASVIGLLFQVLDQGALRYSVGGWGAPLGIDFYTDGLGMLMLLVTATDRSGYQCLFHCLFQSR